MHIGELMEAETLEKPSGVSYRRISPTSIVSVKRHDNSAFMMDDHLNWSHNGEEISRHKAINLLQEADILK